MYFPTLHAGTNPPSTGAITPSSGSSYSNTPLTFTATYTDPDGYTDIKYCYLNINVTQSQKYCLYAYYNKGTNKLYLKDDAGSSWLGGYDPGSSNTIENSYAAINCASTTVSGVDTTLTINWNVTLKGTFQGAKNCYMYVYDMSGNTDGWDTAGTWTVNNSSPVVGTVSPIAGTTDPETENIITSTYTDNDGYQNIKQCYILINGTLSGTNALYAYYNRSTNKLNLRNDGNSAWLGSYDPGSANTISNSYCTLNCANTTVTQSGNTITINWAVTFQPTFIGTKNSYLYMCDNSSIYDGWDTIGTYTINNRAPVTGTVTPAGGSSSPNAATQITTTYIDYDGYTDLRYSYLIINSSLSGLNCLYAYYNQSTNKLYLRDDSNSTWLGGYAPGSSNTMENSYCSINCATTTVSGADDIQTVIWDVTFKSPFTGTKNVYLYGYDARGKNSGWVNASTWTITNQPPAIGNVTITDTNPAPTEEITITAEYTDPDGYENIQSTNCLISASISTTGCLYAQYSGSYNKIYLYNDAGTSWVNTSGDTPGTSTTVENSYCAINLANTTVTKSGTTITINWAVSFKTPFIGTKNLYMNMTDRGSLTTGWIDKGDIAVGTNSSPTIGALTPSSGNVYTNQETTLTQTFSDADGYGNIRNGRILIISSWSYTNVCYPYYNNLTNSIYLRDDANTTWLGGYTPGSSNIIENSQAIINCQNTVVTRSGNDITVQWAITFKDAYTGSKSIYAYVVDSGSASAGWSKKGTVTIIDDITPPIGTITINGGDETTNSTTATLTLSAEDSETGVSQMQFSEDGTNWTKAETYSTTKDYTFADTTEGTKTIYVKYKDAAGNWSDAASDTITLDITPPTSPTISIDEGGTTTSLTIHLTLSAEDSISGISEMIISENLDFSGASWEAYNIAKEYTFTDTTSGTKTIYAKFRDNAGNETDAVSDTVTLSQEIWPMFMQNTQHTGQSPYTGSQYGELKWRYTTGKYISSSPAIGSDGTIYVGSEDKKLYAINPIGTLKWNYTTGDIICSSPAIGSDGTIYVGSEDKKLYAINPDGTLKWSYTTGGIIDSSSAIVLGSTIYIGSFDKKLYAINSDGTLKWTYVIGNYISSSPAIGSDGTIYIGSEDKKLYAINPDGTLKWSYTTGSAIVSSPAIGSDGTIYVGSCDKKLYAINLDGTLKWSYTVGNYIFSSPAIDLEGDIYFGSGDNKIYALDSSGALRWSYTTGSSVNSSPAIGSDGTIYAGSDDKRLYAINHDGTLKWSYTTGNWIYSSPAIGPDGTIYFGSVDKNLYAINNTNPVLSNVTVSNFSISPNADGVRDSSNISADVSETVNWTIDIINSLGTTIKEYTGRDTSILQEWDGTDASGTVVPDDIYTCRINATDLSGLSASEETIEITVNTKYPRDESISIDEGEYAADSTINLTLFCDPADEMIISEKSDFSDASWEPYSTSKTFAILSGDGEKTIYVKFRNEKIYESSTVSDTVLLDTIMPTVEITSPTDMQEIYEIATITGTASDDNLCAYTLEYGAGRSPSSWTTITTGTTNVLSDVFASWDTNGIPNGTYTVKLIVTDRVGNSNETTVEIELSNLYIQNISVSPQIIDPTLSTSLNISYDLTLDADSVSAEIYLRENDQLIRTLVSSVSQTAGTQTIPWDLLDNSGAQLQDGIFYVAVNASCSTGKSDTITKSESRNFILMDILGTGVLDSYKNQPLTFEYTLYEGGEMYINIGSSITIVDHKYRVAGSYVENWYGRNNSGSIVTALYDAFSYTAYQLATNEIAISRPIIMTDISTEPYQMKPDLAQTVNIEYTLTADVCITIEILDGSLNVIKTLVNNETKAAGTYSICWDGTDDDNEVVSTEDNYTIRVKIPYYYESPEELRNIKVFYNEEE